MAVAVAAAVLVVVAAVTFFLPPRPPPDVEDLRLEVVHTELANPVSLAFAPDGRLFFNELRTGQVRIVEDGELRGDPFVALDVVGQGEMGLLGIALSPDFANEPYVYLYYTYQDGVDRWNRISRFPDRGGVAGPEEVILDRIPANDFHNSGRLAFGPDGKLYASVGDAGDRGAAQDPDRVSGSILRLNPDGSRPDDNPFPDSLAYLIGIRNVFGLDFTPGGVLLFTDNGPLGNDEVNRGVPGANYGWPEAQGASADPRFQSPLAVFTPGIAPTGVSFYTGDVLGPAHANHGYFGAWNNGRLYRVVGDVEGGTGSFRTEVALAPEMGGIYDVTTSSDGSLYVSFPNAIGRVVLDAEGAGSPPAVLGLHGGAPFLPAAQGLRGDGG